MHFFFLLSLYVNGCGCFICDLCTLCSCSHHKAFDEVRCERPVVVWLKRLSGEQQCKHTDQSGKDRGHGRTIFHCLLFIWHTYLHFCIPGRGDRERLCVRRWAHNREQNKEEKLSKALHTLQIRFVFCYVLNELYVYLSIASVINECIMIHISITGVLCPGVICY